MTTWNKMSLLDSASPTMLYMTFFHEYSLMLILMIMMLTFYMIMFLILNKFNSIKMKEHQLIEMVWTVTPSMILLFLALPSLKILYLAEEIFTPNLTIKTIGNQWYWSYEYGEFKSIMFDSYMINKETPQSLRLLDVDNNTVVPINSMIRFIITSNDVIHSFTIPSMGMKVDAIPGRLNQTLTWPSRSGLFYGQCSEICGTNHSFMPITLESTNLIFFLNWVKNN